MASHCDYRCRWWFWFLDLFCNFISIYSWQANVCENKIKTIFSMWNPLTSLSHCSIRNEHAKVMIVAYLAEITCDISVARRIYEIRCEGFFMQHLEGMRWWERFNLLKALLFLGCRDIPTRTFGKCVISIHPFWMAILGRANCLSLGLLISFCNL